MPILPNLDELRDRLAIPAINTGRQIHLFGHAAGPVTDDLEGLHAIADENGCIRLISGTEFSMQMYRGQAQAYPRCIPTLARLEKVEDQFLALCRRIAFEDAIGEHPMVNLAERIRLWDSPLYVDREGLAQHYGLATDMRMSPATLTLPVSSPPVHGIQFCANMSRSPTISLLASSTESPLRSCAAWRDPMNRSAQCISSAGSRFPDLSNSALLS